MVYVALNKNVFISLCVKYHVCTLYSTNDTPGECNCYFTRPGPERGRSISGRMETGSQ